MRVTFVTPPADLSGGLRVVSIYAGKLQQMGHTVSVVSPPNAGAPLRHRLHRWITGRGTLSNQRPPSHFDKIPLIRSVLDRPRPVREADVPDADVIIATWWETAEWIKSFSPAKGVKVYFIQHHEVFDYLPVERSRATYFYPFHKIVVARWLQDVMASEYGDASVSCIPNSVDLTQFWSSVRSKQTIPTVGFLYAEGEFKGLDVALETIARAKAQIPDLRALSFGSERPLRYALPNYVTFRHYPSQQEIREIYASCDVWLTASRSEGFNLPAMEAMACRTPVISTLTGWPEEAIKADYNGALTAINDVDGLSGALIKILSLPAEKWSILSENAFQTVASSSWDEAAKSFEQALLLAIDGSHVAADSDTTRG